MTAEPATGERPLVVRCGAFGDMVLITALIQDLARRFARPVDVVTSGPWSEPLLRGQPGIGEILSVRSRKTPYWLSLDQQRVVRRLRARGVGPTWFCDGNDAALHLLERAGITATYRVDVREHPLLPGEQATEQWHRLAQIMPAAVVETTVRAITSGGGVRHLVGCHLTVSAAQRDDVDAWLRARQLGSTPLIGVQIGNKRTMRRGLRRLAVNHKYWPLERWAAVLRHLRQRHPRHAIVLLGTGPEYELNEALAASAQVARVYNVANDLGVSRLVALLACADGLLTVDSGPAHVAAAVDCPEVVLFGKASASLYRPVGVNGSDVRVLTGRVAGELSMLGIEPAQVIAAWDSLKMRDSSLR